MDSRPKDLPLTTLSKLIPPSFEHRPFEHFEEHPFLPEDTTYSLTKAWWLAEASLLAYGDESFVTRRLDEAGLVEKLGMRVRFFAGPTRGAQCVVADTDGFVIVAFRGTRIESFPDPFWNLSLRRVNGADFATNIDLRLDPVAKVHSGFNRAIDEVWNDLRDHLDALRVAREERTFWFTGHSLGAALATIAADRYGAGRVSGLYTFGSPRVGDDAFRERFAVPCYRFVNNTDVVPHIPPRDLLGDYAHVGALRFLDSAGRIVTDPTLFELVESHVRGHIRAARSGLDAYNSTRVKEAGQVWLDALSRWDFSNLAVRLEPLDLDVLPLASLADHMPISYAVKVWNALTREEPRD